MHKLGIRAMLLVGIIALAGAPSSTQAALIATGDQVLFLGQAADRGLVLIDVPLTGTPGRHAGLTLVAGTLGVTLQALGGLLVAEHAGVTVVQTYFDDINLTIRLTGPSIRGVAFKGGIANESLNGLPGSIDAILVAETGTVQAENLLVSGFGYAGLAGFAGLVFDRAVQSVVLRIGRVDPPPGQLPYITMTSLQLAVTPLPAALPLLAAGLAALGLARGRRGSGR